MTESEKHELEVLEKSYIAIEGVYRLMPPEQTVSMKADDMAGFMELIVKLLKQIIESDKENSEPFWHTEKPTEEGQYFVCLRCGNYKSYDVRYLFDDGTWGISENPMFLKLDIIAWHKIVPYEDQE